MVRRSVLLCAVLLACSSGAGTTATSTTTTALTTTSTPAPDTTAVTAPASDGILRAAFYYPWFPEAWRQQGFDPFTQYEPELGYYSSRDRATVERHIAALQYGHFDAGIISWWGQGHRTDVAVPLDLDAAKGTSFQWALYYEREGSGDPSVEQIRSDLRYIAERYAGDASYLRIDDRPALFVYGDEADRCSVGDRWTAANEGFGFYLVLKVFPGYASCPSQPDSWHQYAPAEEAKQLAGYSHTISPGFDKPGEPAPRLPRDPARWERAVQGMVAAEEPIQLVTTFNEWGEGTAVEGATEWTSASGFGVYLDILHTVLPAPY